MKKTKKEVSRIYRLALTMFWLLTVSLYSFSQVQVSGVVSDEAGEPMIGVTVVQKGTPSGTITDIDGKYSIIVANENATLTFSMLSYNPQEIKVGSTTTINVVMTENRKMLDEVVVIGYGSLSRKELTSSVGHVSSENFLNISSSDPLMQIQGKISGVSITNTAAANPNATSSIQIRGASSRSAGLGPLIVIDGIPGGNLTNIHTNDIESIDILKDGAAAAIYGTRGSNGVVIINTKKGTKDGKIHTSYSSSVAINSMIRDLKPISADTYREKRVANSMGADNGANTNWLDEVSRTGLVYDHILTLSGGNPKSNYRASINYKDSEGIDLRSSRREYGGRFSINHTTNSGLFTFTANIAPRKIYRNSSSGGFSTAITANPTNPVMNPNNSNRYFDFSGEQAGYNPVEAARLEQDGGETKLLNWDVAVKLNLLPLLAKDGYSIHNLNTQIIISESTTDNFNFFFRPSVSTRSIAYKGEASRSYSVDRSRNAEWLGNYSAKVKDHQIRAVVGYSYQENNNQSLSGSNKNFISDALSYNDLASGEWAYDTAAKIDGVLGSSQSSSKLIGFLGRVSYDYKERYMITASLRHEGSSRFGANHKWGNFPAISAGWRISEESFMKGVNWINELKIRGDYGVTGNQNFANYQALSTMRSFGDYYYEGEKFIVWGPARNPNYDLRWEKAKNWNLGVDFSLFNILDGSINYYNRNQEDLLGSYNVPIPPYLYGNTFVNVGTMRNNGVEIELGIEAVKTKDFSYRIDFAGALLNSKFLSFSNSEFIGQNYSDMVSMSAPGSPGYLQRLEEGQRVGNFYTYKYAGIDENGDWLIWNADNTEIKPISEAKTADKRITGNGLPRYTASLSHTFKYKNLDLSIFFRGAFDYKIFNVHEFYLGLPTSVGMALEKAYTKNAHITKGTNVITDYFLENGDFIKLDVVSLGYRFNLKNKWINNIRLYATARNLATFTNFSGVDPATYQVNGLTPGSASDTSYYPTTRQFMFGIQVDF